MKPGKKRALIAMGCLLAIVVIAVAAGARINTTASFPVGLYWAVDAHPAKGELVLFCPPPHSFFDKAKERGYVGVGFCPGGYGYLIKKILAAKNDRVTVTDQGVAVNGKLIPNSVPVKNDPAGRDIPRFETDTYTLDPGQVLLMSDHSPRSFDARYFGPIQDDQIRSVLRPVLTW